MYPCPHQWRVQTRRSICSAVLGASSLAPPLTASAAECAATRLGSAKQNNKRKQCEQWSFSLMRHTPCTAADMAPKGAIVKEPHARQLSDSHCGQPYPRLKLLKLRCGCLGLHLLLSLLLLLLCKLPLSRSLSHSTRSLSL